MYLRYNFISIEIEGKFVNWKTYISEILSDQIDFSCEFAAASNVQDNLVIKIRNINEITNYQVSANCVKNDKMRAALDFNENVLIFYCGYDRSISLSYLISLALLKTGRGMLLHCAALEDKEGNGHVYSAFGGVGKTQLALNAVSIGKYRFLGDDLVICSSEGILYPYLRPLCLYSYHYSLLHIKLPKHYFFGPDFIYKIVRRLSHFTLRYFGTKKWFTELRSYYTSRNLSSDIAPSIIFNGDQLSTGGVKFSKLFAVTKDPNPTHCDDYSFAEFVLNTTIPEWGYFDGLSEEFFTSVGKVYRNVMFDSIKVILKNVDSNSMNQISKAEMDVFYV